MTGEQIKATDLLWAVEEFAAPLVTKQLEAIAAAARDHGSTDEQIAEGLQVIQGHYAGLLARAVTAAVERL
jgi:hypothetical protein